VHLVGFIIRIFHDARSSECQIQEIDSTWNTLKVVAAGSSKPLLTLYQSAPRYFP